jgi:hypothetical protein
MQEMAKQERYLTKHVNAIKRQQDVENRFKDHLLVIRHAMENVAGNHMVSDIFGQVVVDRADGVEPTLSSWRLTGFGSRFDGSADSSSDESDVDISLTFCNWDWDAGCNEQELRERKHLFLKILAEALERAFAEAGDTSTVICPKKHMIHPQFIASIAISNEAKGKKVDINLSCRDEADYLLRQTLGLQEILLKAAHSNEHGTFSDKFTHGDILRNLRKFDAEINRNEAIIANGLADFAKIKQHMKYFAMKLLYCEAVKKSGSCLNTATDPETAVINSINIILKHVQQQRFEQHAEHDEDEHVIRSPWRTWKASEPECFRVKRSRLIDALANMKKGLNRSLVPAPV